MLNDIFENRDKQLTNVLKLGHFLARSLRENVEFFKYDHTTKRACYLSESKRLIAGTVNNNRLTKIEVESAENYFSQEKFDSKVNHTIASWLGNLYEDKYPSAEESFSNILSLWGERAKLSKLNKSLSLKLNNINENKDILKTPEFKKLKESQPALITFLKNNKQKVSSVAELKNGIILSNVVANAFGVPRLSYDDLVKSKKFEVSEDSNLESLFNLITRQELIRAELIESKKNFDSIWTSNEKISSLANCIHESNSVVHQALANVLIDIPYFAILSKKQLTEMFNSLLNDGEEIVGLKEIQQYSSYIFECKKTIKEEIINILNEKYGINVQNLKDPVTYRSLLNTQIVIFESLRKLLPKDSIYRPVIKEFIGVLKEKNGVEAIDVNDFIHETFTKSEYSFVSESVMTRYLNFDEIANDLGSVADVLRVIKGGVGGQPNPVASMGGGSGQGIMGNAPQSPMATPMNQPPMGGDPSEEDISTQGLTPEDDEQGMVPGGMGNNSMMSGMGAEEDGAPPMEMGSGQLMASIAELEELINGLKVKLGDDPGMEDGFPPGEEGGEFGEEGEGGEFGGEGDEDGEEGDININTGGGDDEVHVDKTKGSHDIEDDEATDEETGEDSKPSKKKPMKSEKSEKRGKGFPPKKGKE